MPAKAEKPKEIEIVKVRDNRKSIYIEFLVGNDLHKDTFHDNPLKSFYASLEALAPHVCTLAELPAADQKKLKVTGITVSKLGDDNDAAVIVAQKKLKRNGRVLNIATPILPMYAAKEDKGADRMSDDEARAIEKVIKEAKRYIAGEREQGQIVFEDPDKPKKEKGDAPDNQEKFPGMEEPKP